MGGSTTNWGRGLCRAKESNSKQGFFRGAQEVEAAELSMSWTFLGALHIEASTNWPSLLSVLPPPALSLCSSPPQAALLLQASPSPPGTVSTKLGNSSPSPAPFLATGCPRACFSRTGGRCVSSPQPLLWTLPSRILCTCPHKTEAPTPAGTTLKKPRGTSPLWTAAPSVFKCWVRTFPPPPITLSDELVGG